MLWFYEYYTDCLNEEELRENMTKHSKNIIDLIEPGDYVNGLRITSKEGNILFISDIEHKILYEPIKTIVTKEQYAAMEYKIEAD